ncbi:MAG: antitoxin [Lysobacterales bacterium CG02_land_8_20_14_3_00_62_12]|nr:MAG: antitoxin [Xanthomonadales bacterium CG02_land_8_20_14_3_00_62_12]
MMRSTLTIDPDVARLLQDAIARSKKPFKTVVNDALRRGLCAPEARPRTAFKVKPMDLGWDATRDPTSFNRLIDELAVADFQAIKRRRKKA